MSVRVDRKEFRFRKKIHLTKTESNGIAKETGVQSGMVGLRTDMESIGIGVRFACMQSSMVSSVPCVPSACKWRTSTEMAESCLPIRTCRPGHRQRDNVCRIASTAEPAGFSKRHVASGCIRERIT